MNRLMDTVLFAMSVSTIFDNLIASNLLSYSEIMRCGSKQERQIELGG